MDILKFLNMSESLEGKLAEVYDRFGKDFAPAEVSEMFRKLGQDEESHREIVKFEKKLVLRNRGEFKEISIDVSGLSEMLAKIDEIMKADQPITPDQAIIFAIDCEKSAAELHFKKAITVSNPNIAGLMKNLGLKDKDHFSFLINVAKERGIPHEIIPEQIDVPRIRKEGRRVK